MTELQNTVLTKPLPRMRTVKEAIAEIKKADPNTAVTEYHIRQLALSGVLPRVKAGKKLLVNLDTLYEYLANPFDEKFKPQQDTNAVNGIGPIY